mmetsp:Transcript_95987/g.268676  ORF Transcript_95987/g.268676 Transcript_95987/m.268676 type:complete len:202 (-) Transcript_95987:41-646(-)
MAIAAEVGRPRGRAGAMGAQSARRTQMAQPHHEGARRPRGGPIGRALASTSSASTMPPGSPPRSTPEASRGCEHGGIVIPASKLPCRNAPCGCASAGIVNPGTPQRRAHHGADRRPTSFDLPRRGRGPAPRVAHPLRGALRGVGRLGHEAVPSTMVRCPTPRRLPVPPCLVSGSELHETWTGGVGVFQKSAPPPPSAMLIV